MKTIQIESNKNLGDSKGNNEIIRQGGVKRIHGGWYSIVYSGVDVNTAIIVSAKRNKKGLIRY